MNYNLSANNATILITKKALEEKGYLVTISENKESVLESIKNLIPPGASVINGASVTLEKVGYIDYLKSGKSGWTDLLSKVNLENDPIKRSKLRKEASVSDYYLGSVHALTTDGQMIIASNTGSQLAPLAFTSSNLILVIGAQKIVQTLDDAMTRLEEYVYPLEDAHMKEKYGVGSNISKVLIFKKESMVLGRKINIILVNEEIGF